MRGRQPAQCPAVGCEILPEHRKLERGKGFGVFHRPVADQVRPPCTVHPRDERVDCVIARGNDLQGGERVGGAAHFGLQGGEALLGLQHGAVEVGTGNLGVLAELLQALLDLQDFGLDGFEEYYPRQLSGGMRQRAALLRTYLFTSDIMLLDEPFATLDAITRGKMQVWLKELCAKYKPTVILVTHDIEEALLLADTVYVLSPRPAQVLLRTELAGVTAEHKSQLKQEILGILEKQGDGPSGSLF